jgi:hypothetical protein
MTRLIYCPRGKRLSSPRQRLAFLKALAVTGSVGFAAACAGIDRTTPYIWRQTEADFAEAWRLVHGRAPTRHPVEVLAARPPETLNSKLRLWVARRLGPRLRAENSTTSFPPDAAILSPRQWLN